MENQYSRNPGYRDRNMRHEVRDESLLERIKRDVSSWFDRSNDERDRDDERGDPDTRGDYRHYGAYDDRLQRQWQDSGREGQAPGERYGRSSYRGSYDENIRGSAVAGDVRNRRGEEYVDRDGDGVYGNYGATSSRPPYHYSYTEYWIVPGPHAGTGPRGYRRSAEGLKDQICERLASHGSLDASDIDVDVEDCEVTLSGTVPSREQKRLAEMCAESVRAIEDVHNHLKIKRGSGQQIAGGPDDRQESGLRERTPKTATGAKQDSTPAGRAAGDSS